MIKKYFITIVYLIIFNWKKYELNKNNLKILKNLYISFKLITKNIKMGIGDWGLGIGDWGLGIGPNPQTPNPHPPSPIPNPPLTQNKNNEINYIFFLVKFFSI